MTVATTAAARAPAHARTRGPVELALEVTFGLFFVSLFAWFVGFMIEVAGSYTIWKGQGTSHAERMVADDLRYITAAPKSLFVNDTRAFSERLAARVAWPIERFKVREFYVRSEREAALARVAAQENKSQPQAFGLKGGVRGAFSDMREGAAKWAIVATYVAQDVVLRLSVALFAFPAFLLACLVGIVDGLVRRDLRRWRGGRESSFVYHHAKRYTGWALTGGFGLYLTWPFGGFNPAYMVLVFAVLVAATLSTTVASFKKYV